MSNSQHGIGNLARLPNVHKRGPTQHGIEIWKDFRMCTQEVQLSTREKQFGKTSEYAHKRCNSIRDRLVGKTSECAHKRSNSEHVIGNWARLRNVHTRGPTLNTG
ncbi:hypothetical protein PoB_000012500 [Plakobranchus ocellatus]|uniref:Uncharacterized protein n=1 Tax=Plakobranchus ocellatus TaxID=259542 RepID=A0AAV3XR69_9GAST|nr:hypothetical protein PoB_000012500 [Plakobranchus ocellatus]